MNWRMTLTAGRLWRPVLTLPLALGVVLALAAGASGSIRAETSPHAPAGDAGSAPAASASVLAGTWKLLPRAPVNQLPGFVTSVWTGHEMIIHGIYFPGGKPAGATFAYRPATNTWVKLKPGPKPKSGLEATDVAVWTGSEMLVFGLTSGAYNPAANTWRAIPLGGPDEAAVVAWTGHEAIVWGGVCCAGSSRDGMAYNPKTNTWRTLPAASLQPRRSAMGAWTGKELIVAGGFTETINGGELYFRNAAAYNPATNTWRLLPPMPSRRAGGTALWDGKEVLFIGGNSGIGTLAALSGMAYNPKTNHWRTLPAMQFRRGGFAAVWTGHRVLVWGGLSGQIGAQVIPPHGEAYSPAANRWTALPPAPLHGRMVAAAAWTGRTMIVWGGYIPRQTTDRTFLDGAVFRPRTP
jgi:hypothetical protein